jgi:uncharacterized protein (DUF433 family)
MEEIIRDYYPHITKEDIRACLEYVRDVNGSFTN